MWMDWLAAKSVCDGWRMLYKRRSTQEISIPRGYWLVRESRTRESEKRKPGLHVRLTYGMPAISMLHL
jgi:hypothetical protein